jgi:hypothetical protein
LGQEAARLAWGLFLTPILDCDRLDNDRDFQWFAQRDAIGRGNRGNDNFVYLLGLIFPA